MDVLGDSTDDSDGRLLVQPSTSCQSRRVASWRKVGLAMALVAALIVGIAVCSFNTRYPRDVSQAAIGGITRLDASRPKSWIVFLDLQCPFSKKTFDKLPDLKKAFGHAFDITYHVTSLAFHPQAFPAQCCAAMLGKLKGQEARHQFIANAFEHQHQYMNAATKDDTRNEVKHIFAQIAKGAGIKMPEDEFVKKCGDWDLAVMPAYSEVKDALRHQVFGTPTHVIDGTPLQGTESAWGIHEWRSKLTEAGLLQK